MNVVLDTCTFLWIALEPTRLSVEARRIFADPANHFLLSVISAWEIALKYGLGQLALQQPPPLFVPTQRSRHGIALLPLSEQAALYVPSLPRLHKDPFDRLLVSQAIVDNLLILTPDPLIQRYPVQTRW
jgi:PIN domain nuclease of toxin-antitoxin system